MCICDTTIMQTWNVLVQSVLLCSSVVIYFPTLGSVQKIFCSLGDIKLSEEQRWPSTALTSIAATVANLYQTFKPSLARAGQAEDAPEPVLLRTESQLCVPVPQCWSPSKQWQGFCCHTIHSPAIPNPGSEGEGSAGCLLRTVSAHPCMGRREKWICSAQWCTHQPV